MPSPPDHRGFVAGLALLGVLGSVVAIRMAPPEPITAASPQQFSATRAMETLRALVGEETPRPRGSKAAAEFRARVMEEYRRLGLAPEELEERYCPEEETPIPCPRVHNLLVRIAGREPGRAVLLMAHSDSVPLSPGIGDDASGVAIQLEVAKALLDGDPPRNPVLLLVTDGEEEGLYGARAFSQARPSLADIGVVVNLDARGTSGPSRMFETSGPNGWLVRALTAVRRPVTSSLFPAVYERMPNGTDLTIFKERGVPGLNFAFIGGARHYHTAQDNLDNLSLRSLQHQGENALAVVRALAEADLAQPPTDRVVFFDLFSTWIVRWPEPWSLPMSVAAALAIAVGAVLRRRRGEVTVAQLNWAVSLVLFAVVVAMVGGLGLTRLLRATGWLGWPWADNVALAQGLFLTLGAVAMPLGALLFRRRTSPAGAWLGFWLLWAALGAYVSAVLPGASYLFVVPVLPASALALLPGRLGRRSSLWIPIAAAGVVWCPLILSWYEALGLPALFGVSCMLALLTAMLAPALLAGAGAYSAESGVQAK